MCTALDTDPDDPAPIIGRKALIRAAEANSGPSQGGRYSPDLPQPPGDRTPGTAPVPVERLVARIGKKWHNGRVLKIRFLEGDPVLHQRIIDAAQEWTQYANIGFDFGDRPGAEIRISLNPTASSESTIGTDALRVANPLPTMNLAVTTASAGSVVRTTALHEFGHALGLMHEHQSPVAGIPWDVPAVYAYYAANGGSTPDEVDANVLRKLEKTRTQYSEFDPASIMVYPVDDALTLGTYSIPWNTVFSENDKLWIARMYPRPGQHPDVFLRLLTLRCVRTEDWAEDEPYLKVDGKVVWRGDLDNGKTAGLQILPPVKIDHPTKIELYDEDGPLDPDDKLGTITVDVGDYNSQAIERVLSRRGAKYILTYAIDSQSKPWVFRPMARPMVLANLNGKRLHQPHCVYCARIKEAHRVPQTGFTDAGLIPAFLHSGFRGCAYCMRHLRW